MSLQLILGNSGSGKSTYLYQSVIEESIANPQKNYIVIVPEQFTMQTQKELVTLHPNHGIMNIDVLSFDRLAYRVFDELGTNTLTVLEETGKNLVLRKVAQNKADELTVLKGKMTKKGYISEMKSLISELTQYNIDPEEFSEMINCKGMSPAFGYKAKDILTMYQGFLDYIDGKYITTEEILQLLIEVIGDSKMVENSVMVFDGFTGFTPIQNLLMRELFQLTERILVTVTIDVADDYLRTAGEEELFAMSKKMIASLLKMAQETHTEVLEPVKMDVENKIRFHKEGELFHLEQNLFRTQAAEFKQTKEEQEIAIYSLNNPRNELAYIAGQIRKEVKRNGYHYRDCAVVCADFETYRHIVPSVFKEYDIPYFIDTKSDIVFHPFMEMMNGALEITSEHYSYESVSRFLRSGLHNLTVEEMDEFDNYLVMSGVRGVKKYHSPFTIMPRGYNVDKLVYINEIREKFVEPFIPFTKAVSGKMHSVEEISRALYDFLQFYEMEEKLSAQAAFWEERQDVVKAKGYEQIYEMVMNLLDKMVSLLGNEVMDTAEYAKILETGFESIQVGIIPPSHDSIVIGDIERTRLNHIKVIYLVGANDSAIPKSLGNGGILSQIERELLKESNYELAPTDREKAFMQKFYLYLMMTKPSDKLVLTYARVDQEGKAARKSYLIATILKLFPNIKVTEIEKELPFDRIVTADTTRKYFIELLREYVTGDTASKEDAKILGNLIAWYDHYPEENLKNVMGAAFYFHKKEAISQAVMRALSGDTVRGSVSRLEQYANCAYAYFLNYGLKLSERSEYELETVDMGSMYHDALDRYSKMLETNHESWFTITEEASEKYLAQAVLETYQNMTKAQLMENARDAFVLKKMEKTLKRSVWALTKQIRKGRFVPKGFEVDLREIDSVDALRFELSDSEVMNLNGKIDRIDTLATEDHVYVKIIDYKSGNRQLDLLNMYHGLQIQLVLYMNAAVEGIAKEYPDKTVEEGGMFYYHIDNPLVDDIKDAGNDEIEETILKELKVRGIVNASDEVISGMDSSISGNSNVIPVGYNKDGSLKKASKVATTDEFRVMEQYVRNKIIETGEKIHQGEIDCAPYQLDKQNGCAYCPYHGVCGFDTKLLGFSYRKLENIKGDEEILRRMSEGGDERGNEMDNGTTTSNLS